MRKFLLIIVFSSFTFCGICQKRLIDYLPKDAKQINSFIPPGWIKLHTATGDFNSDGIKDYALVIIDSINERIIGDINRSLIILEGTKNGFKLSGYCDSAILCLGCGGVHGDPFENLIFQKNQLIIKHIVGSAYRDALTTRFRYQKNQWLLIGETIKGCFLNARCKNLQIFGGLSLYDFNYLTGEFVIKEFNESTCNSLINKKNKKQIKALEKLANYNITSIWNLINK